MQLNSTMASLLAWTYVPLEKPNSFFLIYSSELLIRTYNKKSSWEVSEIPWIGKNLFFGVKLIYFFQWKTTMLCIWKTWIYNRHFSNIYIYYLCNFWNPVLQYALILACNWQNNSLYPSFRENTTLTIPDMNADMNDNFHHIQACTHAMEPWHT